MLIPISILSDAATAWFGGAGREVSGLAFLIKAVCDVSHGHLRREDGLNLPSHLAIKKHNRGRGEPYRSGSHQSKARIHRDSHPHCPISCCDPYHPPHRGGRRRRNSSSRNPFIPYDREKIASRLPRATSHRSKEKMPVIYTLTSELNITLGFRMNEKA